MLSRWILKLPINFIIMVIIMVIPHRNGIPAVTETASGMLNEKELFRLNVRQPGMK